MSILNIKGKSGNYLKIIAFISNFPAFSVYAADPQAMPLPIDLTPEIIRQDQRLQELEKNLNYEKHDVLTPSKQEGFGRDKVIVKEEPCFEIKKIRFEFGESLERKNKNTFAFLLSDINEPHFIVGQCIGTQSLQNLVKYAQNELIKKGFITTQIRVNPQDLTQGDLILSLDVGRVHRIISKDQSISKVEILSAFPLKGKEILNLKKIDQGLENLKRVSNRDVDIKIEPALSEDGSELIGYSDLIVSSQPYKHLGLSVNVDNSGSESTGEYIGSFGLSLNNPLHLNDVLNLNFSHSLDNWHEDFNQSVYINYSLPFRNYELSATHNEYRYEQKAAGYSGPILYRGETQQSNVMLSRMISRGTHHKTSIYGKAYQKENRNFIENIEIDVQRRKTAGWNAGIQHRQYLGNGLLDLNLDYRRGTGALNAKSAPEENIVDIYGNPLPVEGYARAPLWSADIRYTQPFNISNQAIQYRLNWHGQYAPKILVPQDRFYIGSRYSVRGFDGELMLSGDNGHYLQQELSSNIAMNTQLYMAIDQGWVSGSNSLENQDYLMGGVIGARSYFKGLYLDAFVGHGLISPKILKRELVSGFSLNFSY